MAYEYDAIILINTMQDDLRALAMTILDTVGDSRVSASEGLDIARQATALASSIMTMLKRAPAELRAQVLYSLEHGRWVVEE